jgi:hypothetical protein
LIAQRLNAKLSVRFRLGNIDLKDTGRPRQASLRDQDAREPESA